MKMQKSAENRYLPPSAPHRGVPGDDPSHHPSWASAFIVGNLQAQEQVSQPDLIYRFLYRISPCNGVRRYGGHRPAVKAGVDDHPARVKVEQPNGLVKLPT